MILRLLIGFCLIINISAFGDTDSICQMLHPGSNKDVLGCCKFPTLFTRQLYRDCRSKALRGTANGTVAFYEDSCFLDCVFTAAGINTKRAIPGKFIQDALPFTLESPKSIISWSGSANTIARTCNEELGLADNQIRFTRVYRKALNEINVERPICNLKLAAFWDCIYKNFFKFCYNEFITFSHQCETMRRWTTSCEWWAKNP